MPISDYFVERAEAVELNKLGFNEDTFGYYKGQELITGQGKADVVAQNPDWALAPTYEHAYDWIRRTNNLDCSPHCMDDGSFTFDITDYPYTKFYPTGKPDFFEDPKTSKTQCLKRMIEIIKKENGIS